jgi:hypothetical protein
MVRPTGMRLFTLNFGPAQSQITGTAMGMRVTVKPAVSVTWAATGTPMPAWNEEISAIDGLQGQIQLPDPDQDGFIDGNGHTIRNWSFTATVQYTQGNRVRIVATKTFTHYQAEGAVVDLDNAIPVPATDGTTLAIRVPAGVTRSGDDIVFADIAGAEMFRTTLASTYDGGVIY